MKISMVVAASDNNVIGKDNRLLWKLPNDMAFFKNTTWGMPVIMGRKTFESMGGRPLKGRTNIIITRNSNIGEGVITVSSIKDAVSAAEQGDAKECYIIGGGEIYRQAMNVADVIYLTRVHTILEGDVYFPELDEEVWYCDSSMPFESDEKHAFAYTIETWKRK